MFHYQQNFIFYQRNDPLRPIAGFVVSQYVFDRKECCELVTHHVSVFLYGRYAINSEVNSSGIFVKNETTH